ncbi:MAG TPA: LLM class flavin-dependent oxidoreductase [Burkholderiales bacterium]|jgi:alkanesulfonate monooxygenase SsuD/methylene tetrahydromethanopterin reductase-like flavin-dependent oxidoreductase (luciferase family)
MQIGLFHLFPRRDPAKPVAQVFDEARDQVMLADRLGFDFAWFAEHHFSNFSLCPSPLMMVAWCAGQTQRIRLGAGVAVLPLYNPMRLLDEVTWAQTVSKGRMILGVGTGNQLHEFRGLGVAPEVAYERFSEALDILHMGLHGEEVEYSGRHFNVPATHLSLRSSTPPEIWVAGARIPGMAERIASKGYVPFVAAAWIPAKTLLPARAAYQQAWTAAGRKGETPFGIQRNVYVSVDEKDRLEAAGHARHTHRMIHSLKGKLAQLPQAIVPEVAAPDEHSLEQIADMAVIGDAEHCARRIFEDVETLKITHLSMNMQFGGLSGEKVLASMQRFAEQVVPRLRAAGVQVS